MKYITIGFAFVLVGCATSPKTYYNQIPQSMGAIKCDYKGTSRIVLSRQARLLCEELLINKEYTKILRKIVNDAGEETFNNIQLGLGLFSTATITDGPIKRVLEVLGSLFFLNEGVSRYSNPAQFSKHFYKTADELHCINEALESNIYDDAWYYALRNHRYLIARTKSALNQYYILTQKNNDAIKNAMIRELLQALDKAYEAELLSIKAYDNLHNKVNYYREKSLEKLKKQILDSRDDIDVVIKGVNSFSAIDSDLLSNIDALKDTFSAEAEKATILSTDMSGQKATRQVTNLDISRIKLLNTEDVDEYAAEVSSLNIPLNDESIFGLVAHVLTYASSHSLRFAEDSNKAAQCLVE